MTLEELEMRIRALPGVASDPYTVPDLIKLAQEFAASDQPMITTLSTGEQDRESALSRLAVGLDLPPELYLNARCLL